MSIINLLNQIKNDEIVLPAIQRDFVWNTERIETLLDSIMRGYPVGIILLWETYGEIQFRRFEREYKPDALHTFHDNVKKSRLKVVLDGQQRLQSLYVALYGSYDGKKLYFDVLSGRDSDDFRQEKYDFEFTTAQISSEWNNATIAQIALDPDMRDEDFSPRHYVGVEQLFSMGTLERQKFRKSLAKELSLNEADELRVETNLARFDEMMTRDSNILKASVIDENKPSDSPERKTQADVLEIFVRINRQGMPLSRSDLVFSMLKLNWKESSEALPEFVHRINEGNSFDLDNDFVIRCLFAVSNMGTRFDLDLLRIRSNVETMQRNFQACCDSIASTIDFVGRECWCQSSKVLGGVATLVPFVYYVFNLPKHDIPNNQISIVRKAVYLIAFTLPFSRYADSRLAKFLREELEGRAKNGDASFPFARTVDWVRHWEGVETFGPELLRRNAVLALHVVQGLPGTKAQYRNNYPEIDHIFPRAELYKKGYEPSEIDHFANYWILAKGKNQNKSDRHPAKYFSDVPDTELERALINRDLLDYRRYKSFLEERASLILKALGKKLAFSDGDFKKTNTPSP